MFEISIMFLRDFLKKLILKKSADGIKSMKNYTECKELTISVLLNPAFSISFEKSRHPDLSGFL